MLTESHKQERRPKSVGTIARSIIAASVLASFLADTGLASPINTGESIEHAAALKHAPSYHEFSKQLQSESEEGTPTKRGSRLRPINLMEWYSSRPSSAYLLCVHAWGLSAREFNDFGGEMAKRGFDSAAIDVRGFGIDRKRKNMKSIDFDGTVADIAELLRSVRKTHPEKKIFIVGESMGGAIVLRVAALHPDLVDGVVCSAPAWQIHGIRKITVGGVFDQILGEPGFAARSVVNLASSNSHLHEQWLRDSTYRHNYSIPEAYSYYRLMRSTPKSAGRLDAVPVLVIQGLHDRLNKAEASAKLFKKISNQQKQLLIVAGGEHLVLEEGQLTPSVASYVDQWISRLLAPEKESSPPVVIVDEEKLPVVDRKEVQKLIHLAGES